MMPRHCGAGRGFLTAAWCSCRISAASLVISASSAWSLRTSRAPQIGELNRWWVIAVAGFFGTLLALRRIPVVARALAAPGMVNRLELPHSFRAVEGTALLIFMALGHLPALFALPAGLGDVAAGIAAPLVARRLAQGTGRRAALWFNAFGMTDLVVALTLGALTGFQLLNVSPSSAPISELPLALIPTAAVPLLFALHITSVSALVRAPRAPRSATVRLTAAAG